MTPPSIVGNTLLLTIEGLTVVVAEPLAEEVTFIPKFNSAPAAAASAISVLTWVPLSKVGNTLLLIIDCLTEVPLITSFSTLVPL